MSMQPDGPAVANRPAGKVMPHCPGRSALMTLTKFLLARETFQRCLPEWLEKGLLGSWVLIVGDEVVQVSPTFGELDQIVKERGYAEEDFLIDIIEPVREDFDTDSFLLR
jgi:hypothetical protein